uniref:Uncharacterized protein n=1 Tax=Gasterosteus aculeatus aculeatus TaxID=481459 RepID=A0AAQ4PP16_GASAC
MENYSYFFFLRMDENYNILPHGVNFQDAIFADTSDNRRTFSSLFQFSNSTQGSHSFHVFSFLVGHTGGQQANATEPDFKSKDWVFLNYTYKQFEGGGLLPPSRCASERCLQGNQGTVGCDAQGTGRDQGASV